MENELKHFTHEAATELLDRLQDESSKRGICRIFASNLTPNQVIKLLSDAVDEVTLSRELRALRRNW